MYLPLTTCICTFASDRFAFAVPQPTIEEELRKQRAISGAGFVYGQGFRNGNGFGGGGGGAPVGGAPARRPLGRMAAPPPMAGG